MINIKNNDISLYLTIRDTSRSTIELRPASLLTNLIIRLICRGFRTKTK